MILCNGAMEEKIIHSSVYHRHRTSLIWKPLPDQLDTRYENILERCISTNKRLRTVTCSDVLAEMAAAINSDRVALERSLNCTSSALESVTIPYLDETFEDEARVSMVYSPESSFHLQITDKTDGRRLPRTSSPIQLSWDGYNEEERREIWRKRVLMKKPILFRTYCSHRYPKKSYRGNHRQTHVRRNWPRRVLIDDPRCRTPTPTAMKISWSCIEDVQSKEGILSSPARVDFIDPDGQTPEEQSANEELDNDTFDETSMAELESEESNGENPVANSSDDFRHLQQEVVDEIKRVMAQQSPVRMECMTSPYDVRRRMAFISRRTPQYKLARKKELSLLNANARSFLPLSTSESDDGKSSGSSINPNYNRNASDFSSDCFSTQANSRNGSSLLMGTNSGSFIDSSHEKSSIHQAERFPIQTVISTRRVFPSRRKDRYNALDHIPEYDRNNHFNNDRNGLPKVSTGSLPRCASNPNLIVIRPDSGQEKEIEKEEIKLNSLTRSNSTPNVFSITPPGGWDLDIDQYLQSTESFKDAKQTGLKQTGLKQTGLKQTGLKQTGLKEETGRRNDVTFDTKDEIPPTKNAANDVKSTKFKKDLEKEHKTNNVTTSQKNEAFSKRDCATDSATRPRVTRYKYTLDRRRTLPNSCAPLNLNTVEGVRAKRKRFPEQSDPSFRGYGVKDKYHYYNRFSGNREEGSMKMDHGRGVPTGYSCDEERRHLQPSVNQVRNGPSVANHAARDLPMTNRQKVEKTEGGIDHRTERNCKVNGKIDGSTEVNTEGAHNKYTYHFNGTSRPDRVGKIHRNTNGIPSINDIRIQSNCGNNNRNIGPTNNQSNGPTRFGTMGPTGPTGPMDPTRHAGPTRPTQCTGPTGPVRFQGPTGPIGPNGPARPPGPIPLMNAKVGPPGLFQNPRGFERARLPFFPPFRFHRPPFYPLIPPGMLPARYFCPPRMSRVNPRTHHGPL